MYHYHVKRAANLELALPPRALSMPAARWLYESLRSAILDGKLQAGSRLPATRDLARQYGVARGTVVAAFEQLKSEGYVEGTIGSGTHVNRTLPEDLLQIRAKRIQMRRPVNASFLPISDYGKRAAIFPNYEDRPIRAFRSNLPALDLFPMELWTRTTMQCLRRASTKHLMGCGSLGHDSLRKAVAQYLTTSRGVNCVPGQIAIVAGVQEALDLIARLIVQPGDHVCMEDPGFPGARNVFTAFGARVLPVPVDEDGLAVTKLPASGVKLLYSTPGHQFPLGVVMPLKRRLELLEWARRSGTLIVEDDYDSEFRYTGWPIPAMQGLDRHGTVLYAGSFSKVLFPSLRLGYLVIPDHLVDRFEAAISITSRHAPLLDQFVLAEFIHEGHFGRHIRRMREIYAERLSTVLTEGRSRLSGLLQISEIEAGLQTTAWICSGEDDVRVSAAAAARGVDVVPLSSYALRKMKRQGLQIGFAALHLREIKRGIESLAAAMEDLHNHRK